MGAVHDVVIVGAGPAGSSCAATLARDHGIRPVVLDRATFPRSKVCAGGLSPGARKALEEIGTWPRVEREARHIHSARLETALGNEATVNDPKGGYVLPRKVLDGIGVMNARASGADVREGVKVGRIEGGPGSMRIEFDGPDGRGAMDARWVVIAAGARWRTRMDGRSRRQMHTLMTRYVGLPHDPHTIELVFDDELYPHYGWVFPEPDGICNVGLGVEAGRMSDRTIQEIFDSFTRRRLGGRLEGAVMIGKPAGHPILTSAVPPSTGRPGLLVAGEAACLVNPITGEGIGPALRSGILAGHAVADALEGRVPADRTPGRYRASLMRDIAPSLLLGESFRLGAVKALDLVFENRRYIFGWRPLLRALVTR